MPTHPFLSDEWIDEARRIHEEYRGRTTPFAYAVRVNLVVKGVPFGSETVDAHLDTSAGDVEVDLGHLADPDATLTLDYDTARSILVDPQAAGSAILGGRVKIDGDFAKLILLQGQLATPDPVAAEVAARVKAITE